MIWVEYQTTSPSFFAASMVAASRARAELLVRQASSASAAVE
jgi:hypothetical protein